MFALSLQERAGRFRPGEVRRAGRFRPGEVRRAGRFRPGEVRGYNAIPEKDQILPTNDNFSRVPCMG